MKGLDNLLLAAPQVFERHANARFLLAGDGEQRQRLIELRDHLGLSDRIHFLGHVEDVPSLLAASDILCHPSLAEGLPNAIVEAMASGVPVVASNVGGIPDVVSHEETGLLVPPHDIKAIAGSINRLLDAPDLGARLAANGRRVARERFDLQRNLELLVARLEEECQRPRASLRADARPARAPAHRDADRRPLPDECIRIGGEETELQILSRYLDRGRFRLHIVSLYPFDEPIAVARLRAEGVAIDSRCHALADDDKVAYVRALDPQPQDSSRRRLSGHAGSPTACSKDCSPAECSLVEHGGDRGRGVRDSQGPHRALRRSVEGDPRRRGNGDARSRGRGVPPEHGRHCRVRRPRPSPAPRRLWLRVRRVHRHLRRAGSIRRSERKTSSRRHASCCPDTRRCACSSSAAPMRFSPTTRSSFSQRYTTAPDPRITFAGASWRCSGDPDGVRHPRPASRRRGHVARDQRSRRRRSGGDRGRRRRGSRAARGRRGRTPRAAGASGSPGAVPDRARRGSRRRGRRSARACAPRVEKHFSARKLVPKWQRLLSEAAAGGLEPHEVLIASWDQPLDFPSEIQIQTITSCNAACVMCPYPKVSTEFPHERMDERLYDRVLDECSREPGLRRIEPFLMNEPFTDNRMIDWIARTKQTVPHAMVTVTTNGSPLVPKVTDRLVRTGLDAIWFSFNGATPETYEKIMGIPYDAREGQHRLPARSAAADAAGVRQHDRNEADGPGDRREHPLLGEPRRAGRSVAAREPCRQRRELRRAPLHGAGRRSRSGRASCCSTRCTSSPPATSSCAAWTGVGTSCWATCGRQSLREIWNGDAYRRVRRLHIEGRDGEIDLCKGCSYTLS